MKYILTIFLFFGLVFSGFSQTRNVVADINGVVVQPTNIWTANATNARSGLGLGSAATNPASAFQPSSTVLSNLASSNGMNLTNIAVANVVGVLATNGDASGLTNFPSSLLRTNGNAAGLTNITAANIAGVVALASNVTGTIAISNGGTGATNNGGARANLGLSTNLNTLWTSTNASDARGAVGLGETNAVTFERVIVNASDNSSAFRFGTNFTGLWSGVDGTSFSVRAGGNNLLLFQTNRVLFFTNIAFDFGPTGIVAAQTRTNLGLGATNDVVFDRVRAASAGSLTNLSFQIGAPDIGFYNAQGPDKINIVVNGTNRAVISSSGVSASRFDGGLLVGAGQTIAFGVGADVATTRANLGFSTNLNTLWTATNASNARSAVGLGVTDSVTFSNVMVGSLSGVAGGFVGFDTSGQLTLRGTNLTASVPAFFGYDGFNVTAMSPSSSRLRLGFSTNLNTLWEATNASNARSAISLGAIWLTNTNVTNFRTDVGLGASNVVSFGPMFLQDQGTYTLALGNTNTGFRIIAGGASRYGFHKQGVLIWDIAATNDAFNVAVPMTFGQPATTRTNLGLGWPALTNSNAGTGLVSVNTNGEVVSPTNFWQMAPIVTRFVEFDPPTNATTNIEAARNLHIHSLAISRTGVTSTITLPTNNVFNGDIALVVHKGPTSSVTAIRQAGEATNFITLNQFDEAVEFVYYNNVWQFNHNKAFIEPIYFSGTNASNSAAISRTNLGLGASNNVQFGQVEVLKNDITIGFSSEGSLGFEADGTNFPVDVILFSGSQSELLRSRARTNLGLGGTNSVTFSNITASGTLTSTSTVTAKTNLVVEGFVDFTTNHTNATPVTPNTPARWLQIRVGTNVFYLPAHQ